MIYKIFSIDSFFINFASQVTILFPCVRLRTLQVAEHKTYFLTRYAMVSRYLFTARVKGNINLCLNRQASCYKH